MVLQKLIQDGHLEVMESLIDMNNTVLKVRMFVKTHSLETFVSFCSSVMVLEFDMSTSYFFRKGFSLKNN